MHIAEDKIAEIKTAADIVEIISDHVVLKKAGKNHIGLCPFHSEKTPSFTVSSEKQIFHCFGCGEGGNIFTFLMKKEGVSFPEAIRLVGKRCGIEVPFQMNREHRKKFDEKEILFSINEQAMTFYRNNLHHSKTGANARKYLENRGIQKEIINEFYLGYAPGGWNALFNYFLKKGVTRQFVEKAGLIVPRSHKSGFYDRFRDRIIFPIIDMNNRTLGFGGRVMNDSMPKYMNSPETPIFSKRYSLYGLNKAKEQCRDAETVYIVEGYFDLLALYQHGIRNAVATLGTALTSEQVELLRNRYVGEKGKIILVYDSDAAGIKAAQRSIEIFKKGHVDAYILVLPEGFDPDSYLFQYGRKSFLREAGNALSAMDFLINSAVNRHGLSIDGKFRIVSDMSTHFASIEDVMIRSLYVKELAERLGIDEAPIAVKIDEIRNRIDRNKRRGEDQHYASSNGTKSKTHVNGEESMYHKGTRLERHMLAMMLQFPNILPEIRKRDMLELFQDEKLKAIGRIILAKMSQENRGVSEVLSLMENAEQRNIVTSLAMGEEIWNLDGCMKLIGQFESSRSRYKGDLLQRIKAAEDSNDEDLLLKLLEEKQARAATIKRDSEFSGGKRE